MKKVHLMTGFFLFFATTSHGRAIDYSHWNRAVETAEHAMPSLPCDIHETEQVKDMDGRVVDTSATHIQIIQTGTETIDLCLKSRMENGRDRTLEFQPRFAEHKPQILSDIKDGGLFNRRIMAGIQFTGMTLAGCEAVYQFTVTIAGIRFLGTARIDTRTGCAVASRVSADHFQPESISRDGTVLSHYVETTQYCNNPATWFPEEITETMDIRIKGRFSSFSGKVRTQTRISGCSPVIPAPKPIPTAGDAL